MNNNPAVVTEPSDSPYVDLDERRRAALAEWNLIPLSLSQIDSAKFGWFHIRACIVSGIGFFTDSYDIFAINLVSVMLGWVYFPSKKLPSNVDTAVKVAASVGTMVGQFAFGYLADRVGRKRMYGLELIIIIVATIGQALSGNGPAVSVWAAIVFWRLILGIGIGGDYPLSAVITSEFATTKRRGAMMAAVFAMQGFGILAAAIVALIVLLGYKSAIQNDPNTLDQVWRIVIGLGAVPAVCALYFRLTIPETPRYTMDIEQKINKGAKDATAFLERGAAAGDYSDAEAIAKAEVPQASWSDFWTYFGQWKNGKILLGTAYSWFALDIAWYGLGLNNSFILQTIQFSGGTDAYTNLYNTIVGNIIINLLGSVPGYWITVFTVERIGRKPIQIGGFVMLTILFIILGFGFSPILNYSPALFLVLFTLAQLFFNFGPNSTTFIVPGEVFPTRYRSTGHGISAASGKFGAVVSQVGFGVLKDIGGTNAWLNHLLQIYAFFMLTGIFSSLLIPETTGRSLEELSNEDQTNYVHNDEK
ncbi:phosphate:H+ symporter [Endogone sp. FLAS-F59071]|nr:phosphate:H+ symporter [Endogone sp. FLAS-F59071]|eukprot:RUS22877.1 phosphate:H+ symporter [Endogone sp. FLAS-F59071]